jgi:hypothetical protein
VEVMRAAMIFFMGFLLEGEVNELEARRSQRGLHVPG